MADGGSGPARDGFGTSNREPVAKSPFSGVPYVVPASQGGMRDKLPRINVPPSFMSMVGRAVSSEKVPQWKSQEAVLRFMVMVGAREVEKILDDPTVTQIVNQFSALSIMETLQRANETSRNVLNMAESILSNSHSTPLERSTAEQAVREAVEMTADPTYRERMEKLLDPRYIEWLQNRPGN